MRDKEQALQNALDKFKLIQKQLDNISETLKMHSTQKPFGWFFLMWTQGYKNWRQKVITLKEKHHLLLTEFKDAEKEFSL